LQDILAIFSGNYEIVKNLHPKMKEVLLNNYMNNEDTPESRDQAVTKINSELSGFFETPESMRQDIVAGKDPKKTIMETSKKHIRKLINIILDIEDTEENSATFMKRFTKAARWWTGEIIDNLKPCFKMGLPDVLRYFRGNIEQKISSLEGSNIPFVIGLMTDGLMNFLTSAYGNYTKDKEREDRAEAREQGITLEELYARRRTPTEPAKEEEPSKEEEPAPKEETKEITPQSQKEEEKKSSEEPIIQEEPVTSKTVTSKLASSSHATPLQTSQASQEEQKEPEEKDPEIKDLLEKMEEYLIGNPPPIRPLSRAYQALDAFNDRNIDTSNPVTKRGELKQNAKNDAESILRTALKNCGFKSSTIEANLKDVEIPEDLVNKYKEVVKEEIQARKADTECNYHKDS